jgi:hypothetical protein
MHIHFSPQKVLVTAAFFLLVKVATSREPKHSESGFIARA